MAIEHHERFSAEIVAFRLVVGIESVEIVEEYLVKEILGVLTDCFIDLFLIAFGAAFVVERFEGLVVGLGINTCDSHHEHLGSFDFLNEAHLFNDIGFGRNATP